MILYDSEIADRHAKGETDEFDALTFIFDSGVISFFMGVGSFDWDDPQIGSQTFIGMAGLLTIEVPAKSVGNEATAVIVRLAETYMPIGSDVPVNIFDDGVRATIDEEPWQGRMVILSKFHRSAGGMPIQREQVDTRFIDSMVLETDENGRPQRVATLEREDIIQRDIEGKTDNADFQRTIDPTDLAFQHVGKTATQDINWGALPTQQPGAR